MTRAVLVRDRFTWLAYGHLSAFGYFLYGFGPVVPYLLREQHTSRGVAALHSTAFAVGGVATGLLAPWAVRRFGRQATIWTGVSVMGLAGLGFGVAHALWATLALAVVASAGGILAITIVMAALADHQGPAGPAALTEGNSLAAGVGVLAPLAVSATVTLGWGWRPGIAVVAPLVAILAVVALTFRVRVPVARSVPRSTAVGALPRTYWLAWCCLICTGSVEVCLNLWVSDVMRTHSHASPGAATAAVSAIIGGMCVGRLVGSRLLLRWPAPLVLLGALAISTVGFAVFWLAPAAWIAVAGLILLGLGDSMHFPLGIALVVAHSGGQPDLAVSRASFGTSLAFGVSPVVLGVIADAVGTHSALLLVPAFLGGAATLAWQLHRHPAPVPAPDPDAAPALGRR